MNFAQLRPLRETIRETLTTLFPRMERDAAEAAKIGAPFDLEKLKIWAELCIPLEEETPLPTDTRAELLRRASARRERLDREELRLFGQDSPARCFCDGMGFERWDGAWLSEKGDSFTGPHVRRCRLWPGKNHPLWTEEPRHYARDEGEALCPAAVQCARDRHRRRESRVESERSGRTRRRFE